MWTPGKLRQGKARGSGTVSSGCEIHYVREGQVSVESFILEAETLLF